MRILLINKFLHPNGGSETYIFKLGDSLKEQGHEVQYFGMEHEGRCVGNRVNVYTSDMDFHQGSMLAKLTYPVKTIYSSEARKKLRLVLDDFRPDVCHINNFNYQLTPSMILEIAKWRRESGRKCRIVYTAHDYQLVCPNHMLYDPNTHENCEKCLGGHFQNCFRGRCIHGSLAKSAVGAAEAFFWNSCGVYRYIDTVICCSRFLKTKMDTNPVFAGKTVVLHNFADCVERRKTEKKDYVLYFGRFSEEKGIRTLLQVCRELSDIPFVFAGTGPLEREISGADNIRNAGFQSGTALETLIREARFTVYPSEWYENCPFSIMESQLYGTPVLGADMGGIPELIRNGETGELFTAGDTEDLKEKIRKLWSDRQLTDQYAENCLNRTDFDTVDRYCDKLMKIYTGRRKPSSVHEHSIDGRRTGTQKKGKRMKEKKLKDKKLNGTVIVTYRCNARCSMCNRYKAPSRPEEEISIETIQKLPRMYFTNITGGEPFIRTDLKDIVRELYKKSDRIVISTNGFFTDRIVDLCKEFPETLELREGDALETDWGTLLAQGFDAFASNLPYSVGTRILMELLGYDNAPTRLVMLVQREVADRLAAPPNSPDRGTASVWAQLDYDVRVARLVKPACFWPPPEVTSAVVTMTRHERSTLDAPGKTFLRALVKQVFTQRRKQLGTVLRKAPEPFRNLNPEAAGINPTRRAETLSLSEWEALAAQRKEPTP